MAYTTIDDPSAYFQTALYSSTGGGGSITVTNDGNSDLQPDWIWIKVRNGANDHNTFDSSRSNFGERLFPNLSSQSDSVASVSVSSDGFATGTGYGDINNTSGANNYVAWQCKANGGTTTTNDASATGIGDIDSVYQANTTAGFSIVTHTGSGSAGNIAHGLGAVPEWIVTKNRTDAGQSWANYHVGIGAQYYLELDTTDAKETASSVWGDTTPSSTTFRVGGANGKNNASSKNYVTYCFTSIQGYSKFGSYTGNGNADGAFIYTGFKPSWLLIKRTDSIGDWNMVDTTRDTSNTGTNSYLYSQVSDAEQTGSAGFDILSNGFKNRNTHSRANANGGTYIYMAFASSPFVGSDGVPTTAR